MKPLLRFQQLLSTLITKICINWLLETGQLDWLSKKEKNIYEQGVAHGVFFSLDAMNHDNWIEKYNFHKNQKHTLKWDNVKKKWIPRKVNKKC